MLFIPDPDILPSRIGSRIQVSKRPRIRNTLTKVNPPTGYLEEGRVAHALLNVLRYGVLHLAEVRLGPVHDATAQGGELLFRWTLPLHAGYVKREFYNRLITACKKKKKIIPPVEKQKKVYHRKKLKKKIIQGADDKLGQTLWTHSK